MEHEFDSADAELPHGRGVESLFAYLIVGMGILALFVLGVFALGQSQQAATRAVRDLRHAPSDVPSEIGDSSTTAKR